MKDLDTRGDETISHERNLTSGIRALGPRAGRAARKQPLLGAPPTSPVSPNRTGLARRPPNRALTITVLISLVLHLIALLVVLVLLHAGAQIADTPEKPAEVELVMEEHKGDANPAQAPPPSPNAGAETPAQPSPPNPRQAETPSPPVREPVEARPDSPRETTEPPKASDHPAAASSGPKAVEPAPPAPPAPKITLSGTDSPSDARSWGDHVIPATPDAVFHNRPPEYPPEAVLNGEHGTVVILIHVSPAGTTAGVDVLRSSGYVLLDRAAREAVLRWRFLPAVKGGEPVGSDVTMGFIFDNN